MASKKPAKPIAGQNRDKGPQLPGKAVMYNSPVKSGAMFECPTCHRTLSKGIIYEVNSKFYCKRICIPAAVTAQLKNNKKVKKSK